MTKSYDVWIYYTGKHCFTVDADSPAEAIVKAQELAESSELPGMYFEHDEPELADEIEEGLKRIATRRRINFERPEKTIVI